MSAGGLKARTAATAANPNTSARVQANSDFVEQIGRIRFLKEVDAATWQKVSEKYSNDAGSTDYSKDFAAACTAAGPTWHA